MTKDDLIETLASIEHARWADWQKYLHSKFEPVGVGSEGSDFCLPRGYVENLERQIVQPYAMLSEAEKQADRDEVMRSWPVIVAFVAEWLEEGHEHRVGHPMIAYDWREEMGDDHATTAD